MIEMDHVFIAVESGGGELRRRLDRLGLQPSYMRRHQGQGTENVCYAFDNLYLELLWESDAAALDSAPVAPTRLAERVRRVDGACPIGVAVRGGKLARTWAWQPTFLPTGTTLAVAELSRDPAMPLLFESPGTAPPIDWTDERAGDRQRQLGLDVADVRLRLPTGSTEEVAAELGGGCDIVTSENPGLDLVFDERLLTITAVGPDEHRVALT